MGADGGTIPTRIELVKVKKKPEQKDREAALACQWNNCTISQQQLVKPIVACQLGFLYNKESVIEYLLDKSKYEGADNKFSHIKNLKHVIELNLTANPGFVAVEKSNAHMDMRMAPYSCPVVGFEMNGKYKFCCLWGCGCVLSERALKEVKADACHKCLKSFQPGDIVVLNAAEDDMKTNAEKMDVRKKLMKKSKRVRDGAVTSDGPGPSKQACMEDLTKSTHSVPGSSKSKLASSHGAKGSSKGHNILKGGASFKEQSKHKSIQDDPKASKTLKSLFTSSDKAKQQATGHWVTFNPQYF